MKKAHGTSKQLPALDERSDGILENRGWSAEAKRRFWPKHSWKALMDSVPFCTEGRSQLPVRRQISWRLGPVETMVMGASMCFSMKST